MSGEQWTLFTGFLKGFWYGFPWLPPRDTDVFWSRQVVSAVGEKLADRL